MIATKGQSVRLDPLVSWHDSLSGPAPTAKVLSVIETDGEPGTRRVHLDRSLAGERWWIESSLEAAPAPSGA